MIPPHCFDRPDSYGAANPLENEGFGVSLRVWQWVFVDSREERNKSYESYSSQVYFPDSYFGNESKASGSKLWLSWRVLSLKQALIA